MRNSSRIALLTALSVLPTLAHATVKCESARGANDCDYRVYLHGDRVVLYASSCEYSDDEGSESFKVTSSNKKENNTVYANETAGKYLSVAEIGKASSIQLGKGVDPIRLSCTGTSVGSAISILEQGRTDFVCGIGQAKGMAPTLRMFTSAGFTSVEIYWTDRETGKQSDDYEDSLSAQAVQSVTGARQLNIVHEEGDIIGVLIKKEKSGAIFKSAGKTYACAEYSKGKEGSSRLISIHDKNHFLKGKSNV